MLPVLVATSHGTSSIEGQAAVAGLVEGVALRRPDIEVRAAFVDVQEPSPSAVLTELGDRPAVVVPLLLSAGYHVYVDLTEATAPVESAALASALGPDPRLARLLADRLVLIDLAPADVVIMASAGSSEARAVDDCAQVAADLADLIGRPVISAYLSAAQPRLGDAVAAVADDAHQLGGRVVVASYLLAPGYFADLAASSGADVVTSPLLVPTEPPAPALVDLVCQRWADAVRT